MLFRSYYRPASCTAIRYLDLDNNKKLQRLPETIGEMNLTALAVNGCDLIELPERYVFITTSTACLFFQRYGFVLR